MLLTAVPQTKQNNIHRQLQTLATSWTSCQKDEKDIAHKIHRKTEKHSV